MPKGGWLGQCVRKNGYLAQTMRPSRARPLRTNLYGRLDSPMRVTRAAAPPASARGPRTPHPGRAADSRPGELRRASATETRRYAGDGSEQLGNAGALGLAPPEPEGGDHGYCWRGRSALAPAPTDPRLCLGSESEAS